MKSKQNLKESGFSFLSSLRTKYNKIYSPNRIFLLKNLSVILLISGFLNLSAASAGMPNMKLEFMVSPGVAHHGGYSSFFKDNDTLDFPSAEGKELESANDISFTQALGFNMLVGIKPTIEVFTPYLYTGLRIDYNMDMCYFPTSTFEGSTLKKEPTGFMAHYIVLGLPLIINTAGDPSGFVLEVTPKLAFNVATKIKYKGSDATASDTNIKKLNKMNFGGSLGAFWLFEFGLGIGAEIDMMLGGLLKKPSKGGSYLFWAKEVDRDTQLPNLRSSIGLQLSYDCLAFLKFKD